MMTHVKKTLIGFAVLCLSLVFTVSLAGAEIIINFDDLDAPAGYEEQVALAEEYADLGVHFSGLGEVLNLFGAGFDCLLTLSDPFSSPNALAFDGSTYANAYLPETISFDYTVDSVSLLFGGYAGTISLSGYLDGTLVNEVSMTFAEGVWNTLTLSGGLYDSVILDSDDLFYLFVVDNLTINPVPIPGALWLLGSGLVGLVGMRKRSRRH